MHPLLTTTTLAILLLPLLITSSPLKTTTCTSDSLNNFTWTLSNFSFNADYMFTTPAHQNSWGYTSFNLYNPVVFSNITCSAQSNQLNDFFYGTIPYTCSDNGSTKFTFNRPTGEIKINQSWTCDLDRQYPIVFSGSGGVNLTLECEESNWVNPNWTIGQTYSQRNVDCEQVGEVQIGLSELSAVS
ncbi:hypothetical protein QBC38DRAFT_489727 [Podospora fimiseda]|uniref:AA1-like domain-containing protein n=1 Tax=Podospora fimiseda TaxID=252190 RepID=A0AAN6YRD7_9PEZI|nr:hypothetical protein QBC38DRAFT_489727 [Podospora fimiseda]